MEVWKREIFLALQVNTLHLSSHFYWGVEEFTCGVIRKTDTRWSLNIVFFSKILKYSGLLYFSVFFRCQCVYVHPTGR